jgi:hypothetical protein
MTDPLFYLIIKLWNADFVFQETSNIYVASHEALHAEIQWKWAGASLPYETNLK